MNIQIDKESKHAFGIFIGMCFAYVIGMAPGFLIGSFVTDNPGGVLVIGMVTGFAIAVIFIHAATKIDIVLFGEVTNSDEK